MGEAHVGGEDFDLPRINVRVLGELLEHAVGAHHGDDAAAAVRVGVEHAGEKRVDAHLVGDGDERGELGIADVAGVGFETLGFDGVQHVALFDADAGGEGVGGEGDFSGGGHFSGWFAG